MMYINLLLFYFSVLLGEKKYCPKTEGNHLSWHLAFTKSVFFFFKSVLILVSYFSYLLSETVCNPRTWRAEGEGLPRLHTKQDFVLIFPGIHT